MNNTLRTVTGLILALCFLVALAWFLFRASAIAPSGHQINYDAYMSIMLTALGVMVATFAILVGLAAIWGYAGLRDHLQEMASTQVDKAIQEALKKYPESADMFSVLDRLKAQAAWLDQVQNQIAAQQPRTNVVENASKKGVQEGGGISPATPIENAEQQTTPIAEYPGEEEDDADRNDTTTDR